MRKLWRVGTAVLAASALSGCAAALVPLLAGGAALSGADRADESAAPVSATQTASVKVALPGNGEPPPAPPAAPVPEPAPLPLPVPVPIAADTPLAALQLTTFDPAFSRFAAFASAAVRGQDPDVLPLSALLADPVALDGARARCLSDQTPVVVIDLDPADSVFTPPITITPLPEHAAALAELRDAGITIAWISAASLTTTGPIRSALEGAGLDPRGQDLLALASVPSDRKQVLRERLGAKACLLAIAGDERADFDERFRYLRNPSAGARLETLIGDGPWFLIRNIFSSTPSIGTSAP
ncbi:MAG: hypothetical protein MUF47_02160 [Porphyrobacter sp.]|jgi:hypothetical protein|nr:hypothetical protein [Porphyrobacter sp.]